MRWRFPLVALFVFGASFSPAPVHVTAAALAALVALGVQRSGFASSSQRVAEIARPDE
jgi:Sec-independent protein secretion pathway component TatC